MAWLMSLVGGDGMLCPAAIGNDRALPHVVIDNTMDRLWHTSAREDPDDPDSDLTPAARTAYDAADGAANYMRLYGASTGVSSQPGCPGGATIDTWWWQCPTCGLIVPAVRRPE